MRVFVTGGTGFVGRRLLPALLAAGHEVLLLARAEESRPSLPEGVEVVVGDPGTWGPWWGGAAGCDAAVNLAGSPIMARWDARTKARIRESRLATTRHLVQALPRERSFALVSASGIGIYGDAGERELDEASAPGDDFLARVAREWEAEARTAEGRGARVALIRLGVVLGPDGGALPEFLRAARFLGGPLGSGRQWMSWVHREDVIRAILFLLDRPDLSGPFNVCAPEPTRQRDLARTLGRLLNRPALLPAPALALRLVLGESAKVALSSQRARPRRLTEAGFSFRFPSLAPALQEVLTRLRADGGAGVEGNHR